MNSMYCRRRLLCSPSLQEMQHLSNEFKKLMPHPDGDLHTILNAWNAAVWIQQFTRGMSTEKATLVWGKYNLSQRQFEVLQEYRALIVDAPNSSRLHLSNSRLTRQLIRMQCLGCPWHCFVHSRRHS